MKGAPDNDGSLIAGKEKKKGRERIDRKNLSLRPLHSSDKVWSGQMSSLKANIVGGDYVGQKPLGFRIPIVFGNWLGVCSWR